MPENVANTASDKVIDEVIAMVRDAKNKDWQSQNKALWHAFNLFAALFKSMHNNIRLLRSDVDRLRRDLAECQKKLDDLLKVNGKAS